MKRPASRLLFGPGKKIGLSPGTVHYSGEKRGPVSISVCDYESDRLIEERNADVNRAIDLARSKSVTWIDVTGIHDTRIVSAIGDAIGLHPLVQEDIVSPRQRPKVERDGDHLFVVLRMLNFDKSTKRVVAEQCSIVIGPSYVLTFQETPDDIFGPLRDRMRLAGGRIRRGTAGYLGYAIIDTIIDHYFVVVDRVSESMDLLEERILSDEHWDARAEINDVRRELMIVRRAVWPVREVLGSIQKQDDSPFEKNLTPFLRDATDHVNHIVDSIEVLRESSVGLFDLYHYGLSAKANQIMKVLTIIATIFIPLTFFAGIYGMNFESMPELGWTYGYPAALLVMFVTAAAMVVYFKHKRWL